MLPLISMVFYRASIPPKSMMHIAYPLISRKNFNFPHIFAKFINFPLFSFNLRFSAKFTYFWLNYMFLLPPILIVMHLFIMLYTYWTPLHLGKVLFRTCSCQFLNLSISFILLKRPYHMIYHIESTYFSVILVKT